MRYIVCLALALTGCHATREVEVEKSALVISSFTMGLNWTAVYAKDLEYDKETSDVIKQSTEE
tara:strand:- start:1822 stop:2010 length:189 start_codon:yes stop_codon:yes gene_type:complete